MQKLSYSLCWLLCVLGLLLPSRVAAAIQYDKTIPQVTFAAQELETALKETDREDLQITLVVTSDGASPESVQVKNAGSAGIKVTGSDANGAKTQRKKNNDTREWFMLGMNQVACFQ